MTSAASFPVELQHGIGVATVFPINIKGRFNSNFLTPSLAAFDVYQPCGVVGRRIDDSEALGTEALPASRNEQVGQAGGGVDQSHPPAPREQVMGASEDIRQSRCQFVPCDSLLPVRIHAARTGLPVRRVGQNEIAAFPQKVRRNLPQIHLVYFDPTVEAVVFNIPVGQPGEFGLDFDSDYFLRCLFPVDQDKRDHAAARSKFDDAVLPLNPCKAGEQNGIQREAISFGFLAYRQLAIEKRVACDRVYCVRQIISSWGDKGLITRPLITFG